MRSSVCQIVLVLFTLIYSATSKSLRLKIRQDRRAMGPDNYLESVRARDEVSTVDIHVYCKNSILLVYIVFRSESF